MKKKQGFTLTEIIAVVVIIGLLTAAVIPLISNYTKSGKIKLNEANSYTLELAAKNYFERNRMNLPEIGEATTVLGTVLRETNYLNIDLHDAEGGNCDRSYATILNEDGNYVYHGCLMCDNYTNITGDEICEEYNPYGDEGTGNKNLNCALTVDRRIDNWENEVVVTIKTNSKNALKRVTFGSSRLAFDTEEQEDGTYISTATYDITRTGVYTVKATAVDKKGKKVECSKQYSEEVECEDCPIPDTLKIDNEGPTVKVSKATARWANENREVKIPLIIKDFGSGLDKERFTIDDISVIQEQPLLARTPGDDYYVVEGMNETDITEYAVLEFVSEDVSASEKIYRYNIVLNDVSENGDIFVKVDEGAIFDLNGNSNEAYISSIADVNLTYDNIAPQCIYNLGSERLTSSVVNVSDDSDLSIKSICIDPWGSDCTNETKTATRTVPSGDGVNVLDFGTIEDKAGNISECGDITVVRDTTPPTCRIEVSDAGEYANYKKLTVYYSDNLNDVKNYSSESAFIVETPQVEIPSYDGSSFHYETFTPFVGEKELTTAIVFSNGEYTFQIEDAAENEGHCNIPISTINTDAPTIEIENENLTQAENGVVPGRINFYVSSAAPIAKAVYYLTNDSGNEKNASLSDGKYKTGSIKDKGGYTVSVTDSTKIYSDPSKIGTDDYQNGYTSTASTSAYKIEFQINYTDGTNPASLIKMKGVARNLGSAPVREGYRFANWKDESNNLYSAEIDYLEDKDLKLTAQWVDENAEVYTVSYSGSKACHEVNSDPYTSETIDEGETYYVPYSCDTTKKGYTFTKWTSAPRDDSSSDGSWTPGTTYSGAWLKTAFSDTCNGNKKCYNIDANNILKLTALWTPNTYTVKYDANGGSGSMANTTVKTDEKYTVPNSSYTKKGYTFAKWTSDPKNASTTSAGSWTPNTEYTWKFDNGEYGITNNILTLKAKWNAKTYTIKYDANGGSGSLPNSGATTGKTFTIRSNTFTKKGYEPAKGGSDNKQYWKDSTGEWWYAGAKTYNWGYDNGEYGISNNTLTLYAQWKPKKYKVKYEANGGYSNDYPSPWTSAEFNYNTTYTVEKNWYTREGYKFVAWTSPKADGTGTTTGWTGWSGKWTYDNGEYGIKKNVLTLKAKWEQCPAGTHSVEKGTKCQECEAGKYQPYAGSASCSWCPGGYSCSKTTATQCSAGTYSAYGYSTCYNCPSGGTSPKGSTSKSSCTLRITVCIAKDFHGLCRDNTDAFTKATKLCIDKGYSKAGPLSYPDAANQVGYAVTTTCSMN
jgi:prepilin-type N-terminal cleavage/methylation domain